MSSKVLIQEIFASDVTRNIAPVVYFHEQDPAQVAGEVSEYIVTGGYPQADPRHQRIPSGIHEQFVRLLSGLAAELARPGGADLPASWISGFYGSGKSIFAKLLGLALDGMTLPDGRSLADALLARDDSPLATELGDAWAAARSRIDPMAVVFDVGTVARDDEHIHAAARRQIAVRLGYCATSHLVAEHELKLELDGGWPDLEARAEEVLGIPWADAKQDELAEEHFSQLMHALRPERYIEPMSWFDSHVGMATGAGSSVEETTRDVARMLELRAPGKTLFLVVDEVSQYIHHNESRMLKLQSFVSDLGQKLKGRVWLLATGQQKLEDSEDESNIGKLKDRFPPRLRVHLAPTNIRDVVHKRLLRKDSVKDPTKVQALRDLFQQHRPDLKLYAYACEQVTEEDFVEVYPMLPGHVDLLMQMTSVLRTRSTRVKGDDYAIRGLLQLLGEMFRQQRLGEQELGALVTLEGIFEIQQTALDVDTQNSLTRVLSDEALAGDELALKAAKAVALLGLIQEQTPTTSTLISQCLYARLGQGDLEPPLRQALERLQDRGHVTYSEKLGYQLQSSAGQEWQRERDARAVVRDELSQLVAEKLGELAGNLDLPRLAGKSFPWAALYSDGAQRHDERLLAPRDPATVTLDFQYQTNPEKRARDLWIQASDADALRDRMIWVCGSPGDLAGALRELARSRYMVRRYENRVRSLPRDRQLQVYAEQGRLDELESKASDAVAAVFLAGEIYFRGRPLDKHHHGSTFGTLVPRLGEIVLPTLFDRYVDLAVTPAELAQLLEPQLSGPSHKFMTGGLGILDLDAGKYVFTCSGEVPSRVAQYLRESQGIAGGPLLAHFGGPPYGYPPDVVKAALAGLLRAEKIRIRPEAGPEITSIRDPGARDVFNKDRDLKRADVLPADEVVISGRDRVAICRFFSDHLHVELDRESDAIADAVFHHFPRQEQRLRELEAVYLRLPGREQLPGALARLAPALDACKRSRHVEATVVAARENLDALRDGIQQLGILRSELTPEAVDAVIAAGRLLARQARQLEEAGDVGEAAAGVEAVRKQLASERPWREIARLEPQMAALRERYREARLALIEHQEQQAEEIRLRVKQRQGFAGLAEDRVHRVLHPIQEALYETSPDDVEPSLLQLRDSGSARLAVAERQTHELLDHALAEASAVQVVKLSHKLSGREVGSEREVDLLLDELRERILAQLEDETRVRLI